MYRSQNRPQALNWDDPIPVSKPANTPCPVRPRPRPIPANQLNPPEPVNALSATGSPVSPPLPDNEQNPSSGEQQPPSWTYLVGYKRPPQRSRFKKGQSGNPKGRPKGIKSTRELLDKELSSTVPIREGGRSKKMSKREVIVKRQVNKAMEGDPKSTDLIMKAEGLIQRGARGPAGSDAPTPPDSSSREEDQEIIQDFIEKLREALDPRPRTRVDGGDDDGQQP
jgi:hypothetical protein